MSLSWRLSQGGSLLCVIVLKYDVLNNATVHCR